ncbi:MAG: twin-arginine translocase TatA/TatE family subunit [Planctomycetota bacterium]
MSNLTTLALLDVGPVELLIIALAAIMMFGGDLPDIARRAGRTVARWRAAANELARSVDTSTTPSAGPPLHTPPQIAETSAPAEAHPPSTDSPPPADDELHAPPPNG